MKQPTDWVTDPQGKACMTKRCWRAGLPELAWLSTPLRNLTSMQEELLQLIASRGFGVFDGNMELAAQRVEELRCLLPGLSMACFGLPCTAIF